MRRRSIVAGVLTAAALAAALCGCSVPGTVSAVNSTPSDPFPAGSDQSWSSSMHAYCVSVSRLTFYAGPAANIIAVGCTTATRDLSKGGPDQRVMYIQCETDLVVINLRIDALYGAELPTPLVPALASACGVPSSVMGIAPIFSA